MTYTQHIPGYSTLSAIRYATEDLPLKIIEEDLGDYLDAFNPNDMRKSFYGEGY